MKIEQVAKLSPQARLLYWIRERHQIYLRRKAGKPTPWTDDQILQTAFFTNPYREHDRTTIWLRENFRDEHRKQPSVVTGTIIYRWFNRIETGQVLLQHGLLTRWKPRLAMRVLGELAKPFTSAYIISTRSAPKGTSKLEAVCNYIDQVWNHRTRLPARIETCGTMQQTVDILKQYEGLGPFMSYEIACDLRYTRYLQDAPDVTTYTQVGPGARRGLYRLQGLQPKKRLNRNTGGTGWYGASQPTLEDEIGTVQQVMQLINGGTKIRVPVFEMREVEHSLCEWDKYERVLQGERPKRKYMGA